MSCIGYTPGGSPIFFGRTPTTPKHNKNTRFKCKGCQAKTTKNQRKANGDICHQCKKPFGVSA